MAGAMRKMAVYLGLVEEDDRFAGYDEYDEYVDPVEGQQPAPRDEHRASVSTLPERGLAERRTAAAPAATRTVTVDPYRITTLHPRTYNEARTIGENFRQGTPVIMNLSDMDDVDAKRLVDFAAGLVFGLHGTIERVTQKVFLLSPANVDVTAEDKARIAEGGFFNQS